MKRDVDDVDLDEVIAAGLSQSTARRVFDTVTKQDRTRGWALLLPAEMWEMTTINGLVDSGLIALEPGVHRFDHLGRAKSAEVVCHLTDVGKLAAALLASK
jgi:hypothetical protein